MFKHDYGNGEYIEGNIQVFNNGNFSGRGTYYWPNGDLYFGDFLDGYRTGKGIFFWNDNCEVYEGDFYENQAHGFGYYWYSNGDRFQGSFVNGAKHGDGILYRAATHIFIVGTWQNGDITFARLLNNDKRFSIEGPMVKGKFHGRCIYTLKQGQSNEGFFTDGKWDASTAQHLPHHVVRIDIPDAFRTKTPTYLLDKLPVKFQNISPIPKTSAPPSSISARTCEVKGPGLSPSINCGKALRFAVRVFDESNNQVMITQDKLQLLFLDEHGKDVGKSSFDVHTEEKKGVWIITYICRKPGRYTLHVKVDHVDIGESPYKLVTVEAAPPPVDLDFKQCTVLGSGITSGKVGVIQKFAIQLVNTQGVRVAGDVAKVRVRIELNGKDVTELFKSNAQILKGYWVVTYTPTVGGRLSVHVYINEHEIPSSPFTTPIEDTSKGIDPHKCNAKGPGLQAAQANVPQRFVVQPFDNFGQPVSPEDGKM